MQNKHPAASPGPRQPGSASDLTTSLKVTGVVSKPRSPPFVVQLCESARPIEPRDVPCLDLFDLYHLYRHSNLRDAGTQHSLRLGYFKEPGNAKAIAAYLARYFRNPLILQIDATEIVSSLRARFSPEKDIGASGVHSTVVLATPPCPPAAKPADLARSSPDRDGHERSLWSRLLGSLRRLHAAT